MCVDALRVAREHDGIRNWGGRGRSQRWDRKLRGTLRQLASCSLRFRGCRLGRTRRALGRHARDYRPRTSLEQSLQAQRANGGTRAAGPERRPGHGIGLAPACSAVCAIPFSPPITTVRSHDMESCTRTRALRSSDCGVRAGLWRRTYCDARGSGGPLGGRSPRRRSARGARRETCYFGAAASRT
jgi:hypothetical protein